MAETKRKSDPVDDFLADGDEIDAFLKGGVDAKPEPKQFSEIESGMAGAAQGLGSNFLDELYGARKGAQDVILGDAELKDLVDRYRAHRDEARQYYDQAEAQNPKSYGAGNIVGGTAQAFIPGAAMSKLGAVGGAAASAGAAGLGASDKESTLGNIEDAAKSAAAGAALGYAGGKILPSAKSIKSWANEKAVKASGAMTKEMRALESKGLLDKQGEFLLENKIVTPLASLENISERSDAVRQKAGEKIGGIIDNIDALRAKAIDRVKDALKDKPELSTALQDKITNEFGYNYNNVADQIDAIIERDSGIAASKFHRDRLSQLSDEFRRIGEKGSGTLRSGLRNKTEHRRLLKDVDNLGEEYKQEVYDAISGELDRSVSNMERLRGGVDKLYGDPIQPLLTDGGADPAVKTALDEFKGANRDYAASATAQATADKRLGQVRSNRDYGLTTAIAAGAGLAAGGPATAVAYGSLNNFFRKYGSSLEATGGNALAKMLQVQPEAFGQYAAPLGEALRRGPRQFLVTNYLIGKGDPQYAGFLDSMLKDDTKIDDPEQIRLEIDRIKSDKSLNSIEKAKRLTQINRDGFIEVPAPAPVPEPTPPPVRGDVNSLIQSLQKAGGR